MQRTIRNGPSEEANGENQPMEQPVRHSARELARWCHNTAQDQRFVLKNSRQQVVMVRQLTPTQVQWSLGSIAMRDAII
jgi:hypothetical protein